MGFSKGACGLRQGDPLFPFLINFVMEVLECLVAKVESKQVQGCVISPNRPLVTLLQFVDDSLFFLQLHNDQVANLWCLLMFEALSGLKVNLPKRKLMVKEHVPNMSQLAENLRCQVQALLTIYLGLPIGGNHRAYSLWDMVPMASQMERQISFNRGKDHSYQECFGKHAGVLSFFICAPASILQKLENL